MTKDLGSTYLCNRQSHRWLGKGEVVTGGYSDVVIYESHLSTACTAAAGDDGVHFLEAGDGEGGSSPATSPSRAVV